MPQTEIKPILAKAGMKFEDSLKNAGVRGAIAVLADGREFDLSDVPEKDIPAEPILLESDRGTRILRHSAAHLLAQAVTEIFPDAKPNAGPPTEDHVSMGSG
ncbi:MAG: threonine--tRNA ligase, partial [Candidatus Thermoplasmatota archaeon]|nr:threonine--tRNA ligase [Candidatus Thermoplasmatota archaeon]